MKMIENNVILNEIKLTPIQYRIYEYLKLNGKSTRGDICKSFGFGILMYESEMFNSRKSITSRRPYKRLLIQHKRRTTIYDNLIKLMERKIVEKISQSNGNRGRPKTYWIIIDNNIKIKMDIGNNGNRKSEN